MIVMVSIGITGQSGFIGTHLYNHLKIQLNDFTLIPFKDRYFDEQSLMDAFVSKCDTIVHLAAVNRHNDNEYLYKKNIDLVNQLIASCERTDSKPHIIFSSSIHETMTSNYGKSKLRGKLILKEWSQTKGVHISALKIPNVYGPFCSPNYNSVVATFCHKIAIGQIPEILNDSEVKLIHVSELVEMIGYQIQQVGRDGSNDAKYKEIDVSHTYKIFVSDLLALLLLWKQMYLENGVIPPLDTSFNRNLFTTFLTYTDFSSLFPFRLKSMSDDRGRFVEVIRSNSQGQVSISYTNVGVTRGNHFHTRKVERFAVVEGKAKIELRRIGEATKYSFVLNGDSPEFIDIPVWYTHNITNIGDSILLTVFWINEHYNELDPDTYFENV
jgi:UDP-2-acetamido-2,6-beta-L-arabino-hexul-4-ose reductase